MSAIAAIEQLDLLADPDSPVRSEYRPRLGRILFTIGGGWRARWTGPRFGWVFDRAIRDTWESWEPTLAYGVEHVLDRTHAETILASLVTVHGDDPRWLQRRR